MKTILTRTLMVTLLATSISAFAQSDDGKRDEGATKCNVTQQDNSKQKANDAGTQPEQKSSDEQKIEQQDQDWLHDLQSTYGG
ncbi:MAG TPA: hypothetical protein VGH51_07145 [Candidatus Angelobacter sp.]|jgi:hypothetical protein